MATMSDIARLAGVSHGTVSNVLNNRGNVSAQKIKLVQEAARQVGYIINAPAHQLRSSSALSKNIGVILPNITESRYAAFYTALQTFWPEKGYQVSLWLTNDTPFYERNAISSATAARVSALICVSCLTDPSEDYQTIEQYGGRVIYIEREYKNAFPFIGYDYKDAGIKIAERILSKSFASVLVATGLEYFSNENDFEQGFFSALAKSKSGPTSKAIHANLSTIFQDTFQHFQEEAVPDCVVLSSKNFFEQAEQAFSSKLSAPCPPMFTITTSSLEAQCNPNFFCMDYSALALKASQLLFDFFEKGINLPLRLLLAASGFFNLPSPLSPITKAITLNVLLVQDQSASAIMQLTPQFTRDTHIHINYVTLPLEELTTVLSQLHGNHFFDVIRTNITTTPQFPEGTLLPIDNTVFSELTKTMYPKVVHSFSYCHGQASAVPFDIGAYFYVYRKDLFSDPIIRRTYLEKYGRELEIPSEFKEFNQLAAFFCRSINPDSPVPYGTTGPSGDMALIFSHFLFIYRNLGGALKNSTGNFTLDRDRALQAIRLQMDLMPYSLSFQNSRRDFNITNFIQEKTAIEIASTSHACKLINLKQNSINGVLGFSALPANTGTLGGGALAIPSSCKEPAAAEAYIQWACGYQQAFLFTLLGGTTPHKPIYTEYEILNLYPWFRLMDQTIENTYSTSELDIFDRYQLERFMGFTLRNIYFGVIPIDHCLDVLEQGMRTYLIKPNASHETPAK